MLRLMLCLETGRTGNILVTNIVIKLFFFFIISLLFFVVIFIAFLLAVLDAPVTYVDISH